MTREELATFNGLNGQKAYAAVNGKVYDFTDSPLWTNGDHQGAHQAGVDLTEELKTAPHVRAVIERFPIVGTLADEPEPSNSGKGWIVAVGAVVILAAIALLVTL